MKQYRELAGKVLRDGTLKEPARENMPKTLSIFGHQMRFNLADGFPIITTKEVDFKNIVTELMWFLKGMTNIKFLMDHGFNMWNEDAYNYYCKVASANDEKVTSILMPISSNVRNPDNPADIDGYSMYTFEEFISVMKNTIYFTLPSYNGYTLGDCGFQYGKVWRDWQVVPNTFITVDQIKNVLNSLKTNPMGRRHIVTAIDPAHDQDLALYWCHSMFQFNCRPLTQEEKIQWVMSNTDIELENLNIYEETLKDSTPKYYLDLQLYQRSGDLFLGVPYNISSYALLLTIFAEMLNMVPGEYIHTFGDVHLYENHIEQITLQLSREEFPLPKLVINPNTLHWFKVAVEPFRSYVYRPGDFKLVGYQHHEKIKGKLSTGLR
jgi:thymidylate synthase